jgi:hypothetical protein
MLPCNPARWSIGARRIAKPAPCDVAAQRRRAARDDGMVHAARPALHRVRPRVPTRPIGRRPVSGLAGLDRPPSRHTWTVALMDDPHRPTVAGAAAAYRSTYASGSPHSRFTRREEAAAGTCNCNSSSESAVRCAAAVRGSLRTSVRKPGRVPSRRRRWTRRMPAPIRGWMPRSRSRAGAYRCGGRATAASVQTSDDRNAVGAEAPRRRSTFPR